MRAKKTHEEYENQLFEKEIDLWPVEPYQGYHTAIKHECKAGHIRPASPTNVLNGMGCKDCSDTAQRKTTEEYLAELSAKNIVYTPMEDYKGAWNTISHKCPSCSDTWKIAPSDILNGKNCPKCSRKSHGVYNKTYFKNHPDKAILPGILYVIVLVKKTTSERACVKVGITKGTANRDVLKRAAGFTGYEPRIQKLCHGTLQAVYELEQSIHEKFKEHQYKSDWAFGGHTELFELSKLSEILKSVPNKCESS